MNILPTWIKTKENNSEKRSWFAACATFTVVSIIVSCIIYFGNNIANDSFNNASGLMKFFSVAAAIFSFYSIWKAPDFIADRGNGFMFGVFLIGPTLVSLACAYF